MRKSLQWRLFLMVISPGIEPGSRVPQTLVLSVERRDQICFLLFIETFCSLVVRRTKTHERVFVIIPYFIYFASDYCMSGIVSTLGVPSPLGLSSVITRERGPGAGCAENVIVPVYGTGPSVIQSLVV